MSEGPRYERLIARLRRIAANPYSYMNQGDRDAIEHAARVIEKLREGKRD